MFTSLRLKKVYHSQHDDLNQDFLIPVLSDSVRYDRGTGFFSLDVLSGLANGLIPYLRNGGNIRIITSVKLGIKEAEALEKGYEIAENILRDALLKEIEEKLSDERVLLNIDLIVNLIAAGRLSLKVAYIPGGLYHEKFGCFEDAEGNWIRFIGSLNETLHGYSRNIESIDVRTSMDGDLSLILDEYAYFEKLWNNQDLKVRTIDFPEAAESKIIQKFRISESVDDAIERIENYDHPAEIPGNNPKKTLYDYQQQAIDEFFNNGLCHFYEMATGTGKTFTAIRTIQKVAEVKGRLFAMVIVPQIDLQIQWQREFEENGIKCHLIGGKGAKDADAEYTNCIIDYQITKKSPIVCIAVDDTYFSDKYRIYDDFSKQKPNINKMIVIDEAHNLSYNQLKKLSENIEIRLGLSATPERFNKHEIKMIINYFTLGNAKTYKYTIDQAIRENKLSHYLYYPIDIRLTDEEFENYAKYTKRLAVALNQADRDDDLIGNLRRNRSVVVKKAKNKLLKMKEMIASGDFDFKNSVIYCGQGKDDGEKIIDKITQMLKEYGNLKVSQYTSNTEERIRVLESFESGYYDTLVAIKCFDQGVDIPKLDKIYILSSDTSVRQTIQRRGRVLRKCKESGKEIARIYDMIALPPESGIEDADSLVRNELKRLEEYRRLADNKDDYDRYVDNLRI